MSFKAGANSPTTKRRSTRSMPSKTSRDTIRNSGNLRRKATLSPKMEKTAVISTRLLRNPPMKTKILTMK